MQASSSSLNPKEALLPLGLHAGHGLSCSNQLVTRASCIPVPCDFRAVGLTCVSISEGKHIISGHAQCHLEGSSGFPQWKQRALKVIMGWEACSAARPSIYKERLPFLPGDRTTRGGHSSFQLTPIVSQESLCRAWGRDACQVSGPGFPMNSAGSLFSVLGPQKKTIRGPSIGVVGPRTISFPLGFRYHEEVRLASL